MRQASLLKDIHAAQNLPSTAEAEAKPILPIRWNWEFPPYSLLMV